MSTAALLLVAASFFFLASLALHAHSSPRAVRVRGNQTEAVGPAVAFSALRSDLRRAVGWAFAVRLMVGALLLITGADNFMAPDSVGYTYYGGRLAAYWQGLGPYPSGTIMGGGPGRYVILNAAVAYVFGPLPLLFVAFGAAAGAGTVALSARIAFALGGADAARRTLWLVAFFPSLVLWSSLNMRDPHIILAIAGCVWAGIQLKRRVTTSALLQLGIWLMVLGILRDYMFAIVAASVLAAFAIGSGRQMGRNVIAGSLVGALVFFLGMQVGFADRLVDSLTLADLNQIREGFTIGANSSYLEGADLSTIEGVRAFLPLGLVYFLLAPFPWDLGSLRQMVTVPEMLVLYALIPAILVGIRAALKRNPGPAWMLLVVLATIVLSYALVSGNVGTAYRHRAQVLPLMLCLAAVGLSHRRARKMASSAGQPAQELRAPTHSGRR